MCAMFFWDLQIKKTGFLTIVILRRYNRCNTNSLAFPPPQIYVPSFSVYSPPFIPIFQSFFPHFSDLPPVAYVYVRQRFVFKFQFNPLRAQLYHAISHIYILRSTSCVGVMSCLRRSWLYLEPKPTPQWQLYVSSDNCCKLLEEEIYWLKLSLNFPSAIINSFRPHYQLSSRHPGESSFQAFIFFLLSSPQGHDRRNTENEAVPVECHHRVQL